MPPHDEDNNEAKKEVNMFTMTKRVYNENTELYEYPHKHHINPYEHPLYCTLNEINMYLISNPFYISLTRNETLKEYLDTTSTATTTNHNQKKHVSAFHIKEDAKGKLGYICDGMYNIL